MLLPLTHIISLEQRPWDRIWYEYEIPMSGIHLKRLRSNVCQTELQINGKK